MIKQSYAKETWLWEMFYEDNYDCLGALEQDNYLYLADQTVAVRER